MSEIGKQLNFKDLKMTYAAVIRLVRMGKVKRIDVGKYVTAI